MGSRADDIFLEGVGRSPNQCVRVRMSHCADWQASQRLPHPHGSFLRVYLTSMTLLRSTLLGKLLKQQDRAHQLCIQCFEAIDTPCCTNYMLLNSSSQCSMMAQQLELCRGWKWYVGRLGEMLARLTCCRLVHLYANSTCLEEMRDNPRLPCWASMPRRTSCLH